VVAVHHGCPDLHSHTKPPRQTCQTLLLAEMPLLWIQQTLK
jgi:hypothetical protein